MKIKNLVRATTLMKVFKFHCEELFYGYAAQTKEEAIKQFTEDGCDRFTHCEEIPERDWDKRTINVWEDNDFEKKPFKISIREAICGTEPQMIFSNSTVFL